MVVLGQKWLFSGKVVVFGQYDCIQAGWLYSGKKVVFDPSFLCSGKMVVFGQKWFYLGKSGCFRKE